jgi:hypothetical protein
MNNTLKELGYTSISEVEPPEYLLVAGDDENELPKEKLVEINKNKEEWNRYKAAINLLYKNFDILFRDLILCFLDINKKEDDNYTTPYEGFFEPFIKGDGITQPNKEFFNFLKKKGISRNAEMLNLEDPLIIPINSSIDRDYLNYYFGGLDLDSYEEEMSFDKENLINLKTFKLYEEFLKEEFMKENNIFLKLEESFIQNIIYLVLNKDTSEKTINNVKQLLSKIK